MTKEYKQLRALLRRLHREVDRLLDLKREAEMNTHLRGINENRGYVDLPALLPPIVRKYAPYEHRMGQIETSLDKENNVLFTERGAATLLGL